MTASTDPALPPPRPAAGSSPTSPSGPRARSSRPNAEATDSPTRAALEVAHLDVATGGLGLVHDVTFSLHRGDRVGLIGESGSGKSLTALAIMGLLPDGLTASGAVRVPSSRSVGVDEGGDAAAEASAAAGGAPVDAAAVTDVVDARESVVADLRGRVMSMVFQEPMTALNPLMRVGRQVAEVMVVHQLASRREAKRRALELLGQVQLRDPAGVAHRYPHQLSGGQRQRVMLAIALANDPDVLICDEPTTALDVTVQAQMLDLIVRGAAERDAALLFITHDLAVVATVCDRVMVMYGGHIVESGSTQRVFMAPRHPYTRGLVMASDLGPVGPAARGTTTVAEAVAGPQARIGRDGDLPTIPGSVPAAGQFPSGCVFRTRCERADDACRVQPPWDGAPDEGWACVHPYAGSASETEGRKP